MAMMSAMNTPAIDSALQVEVVWDNWFDEHDESQPVDDDAEADRADLRARRQFLRITGGLVFAGLVLACVACIAS
jgi:hypothetical protein